MWRARGELRIGCLCLELPIGVWETCAGGIRRGSLRSDLRRDDKWSDNTLLAPEDYVWGRGGWGAYQLPDLRRYLQVLLPGD